MKQNDFKTETPHPPAQACGPTAIALPETAAPKWRRCPFCRVVANLPKALHRAIVELADAAAASL